MKKIYFYAGKTRQYDEGKQPEGAVEVKPEVKAKKTPANKSRQTQKTK